MLLVGRDKAKILDYLPDTFLLIDDGELIDQLPRRKRFDVTRHHLNPLEDMNYLRAREFISVLDAVFPEGENTLTKKISNFQILSALLDHPTSLRELIPDDKDHADAYQKINTLLLSPVLKRVLSRTSFPMEGTILAPLDRAKLGDFDAFVLGNLLISAYKGPVVIPDFGFYGCHHHTTLIRQNRLIAAVNFLDETELKNDLLLMDLQASHCLPKDAETLAQFRGLHPGTNKYNEFIEECV